MKRAGKDTLAGRRYLDLQREAKRSGRPTDELIQLYALECFLDRLVHSEFADTFILKGGVLLAALDARRPTRDIDFAVRVFENSAENVLSAVRTIAAIPLDDGMTFDSSGAAAEAIREEDSYSGIRVTLGGTLSRAVVRFHVDVNVGDPIWPEPQQISLPRLIDGAIPVRGYPLEMVLAEKIVTALERGTVNTRWRDFVDIYVLTRHYRSMLEHCTRQCNESRNFATLRSLRCERHLSDTPRLLSPVGSSGCGSNVSTTRFRPNFQRFSRVWFHLSTR